MAKFNTENSSTLSRFAKDKRVRTSEPKRKSYNPHFTDDNRLKEQYSSNEEPSKRTGFSKRTVKPVRGSKPFGTKSFGSDSQEERSYSSKPQRGRGFGSKPQGGKSFGNRTEGGYKGKPSGKPSSGKSFSERTEGGYKGRPRTTERKSYPKFNPNKQTGEVRLNRFVAQSGVCSRREADELITAGLVSVNGVIVTELGTKVMPGDEVRFNGEKIQGEHKVYLLLNKPKGYVTTIEDDHAAKTVMELVAGACTERIYPVGRLDKNSLGLLLFTNDGDITRTLTHPSLKKKKIYEVTLDKPLTRADFDTLAEGVDLEDGAAYFDEISWLKDDKKSVGVEIHSGRNRIVRRMFEHLGYQVTKLDRVYYAGLTKKNLKRGAWRFLTVDEVNRLKSGRYE